MSKTSKIGAINTQFRAHIEPLFYSWGLSAHPNPTSYFGRSEHGYRYDFADTRDTSDIKLAAFSILTHGTILWIKGYRAGPLAGEEKDLPILFDDIKDIFTLTRRWSFRHPLNIRFELRQKKNEPLMDAAARLISDVADELPRLKHYLYG